MKDIADMTPDELNALPAYVEFTATQYVVAADGTVTLPDGRVLRGLTPGNLLNVPHRQNVTAAYFVGEKTPLCWRDADGVMWQPVRLTSGEWLKQRA